MHVTRIRTATVVMAIGALVLAAACSSSSKPSSTNTTTTPGSSAVKLTVTSFTADFSAMAKLKALAAKGSGLIGVLLPDTTSSARYESYDRPYLKQAFEAAGLSSDQFKIDNAQGSATTMQ